MKPSNSNSSDAGPRRVGQALVALQFGLMGLLAMLALSALSALWSGPFLAGAPTGPIPVHLWAAAVAALAGLALGAAAVAANRPGNFNIHPAPRAGARLIDHGPYRWVRHPMYTAVLLLATAATLVATSALALVAWVGLLCTLVAKASLEERWLCREHAGYAALQARTWRFVPWVY